MTLVIVGIGLLPFASSRDLSLGNRSSLLALITTILLPCIFYSINRMLGITLLTPEGMQLRTLVSRRRIPWDDITKIEVERRSGQGGPWQVVRVHVARGRPVVLPGAMQSLRGQDEAAFQRSVNMIHSCWQQATAQHRSAAT
ncbi:PH domain-containing protein [Streptomyces sp. NBC_01744]|uniref:PH domain-containing protein n=2 Tax=unclassified Streptomyces TaxID=2593676 RepID=UPI003D9A9933|nr:PH domain-containing protein [Streptomyces sp. NBC_01744]